MKTLKTEFEKRGFQYRQIWRDENYAIYSQTKYRTHYEVIKIRVCEDRILDGREIEGGEIYPGDKKWGVDGFTLLTESAAFDKVGVLKERDRKIKETKNVKH